MPANWQDRPITITLEDRPVRMPLGELAPPDEQPVVGSTIDHWADTRLAYSWLRQAKAYLDDRETLAECDAPPNFRDLAANTLQADKQQNFVMRVAYAISQYYNALNLVAMNDPVVRKAYHKWVSGPPAGADTSQQLNNWFKPILNFGGGSSEAYGRWSVPNENNPIFGGVYGGGLAQPPGGAIGLLARSAFGRFFPGNQAAHPSEFVVNVGINLKTDTAYGSPTPAIAEYQIFTRNVPNVSRVRTIATSSLFNEIGVGFMPDGTKLPPPSNLAGLVGYDFWDWRAVFFDQDVAGPAGDDAKLGLIAPMRAYLDFLNEIVAGTLSRTARQVIQDTRVFVAWLNARQIITGFDKNPQAFIRAVSGVESDALAQQLAGDAGVSAASRIIGGVGPAIGAAVGALNPIAGGIIALVSGAASGVLALINTTIKGKVTGHGKDDLGRWKPVLQRGVLSGDVTDPTGGKPMVSNLEPPPIGLLAEDTRVFATPVVRSYDDFDWGKFKVPPKKEDGGSIWPWALGAALVIGGAVAVSGKK